MSKQLSTRNNKALKKRIITPDNIGSFIKELPGKSFKCFNDFADQLIKLQIEFVAFAKEHEDLQEKTAESNSQYKSLVERLIDISKDMKDKNPKQYKKLTARIYDTNKKSATFQNVKIKKALIEKAKEISKPEWQDIQIESLVENIFEDYIKMKTQKSEPKRGLKKLAKKVTGDKIGA